MQDYIDLAEKNGVTLLDTGKCQFCGAATQRGIHECLEIFNLSFSGIDFSRRENHIYRFLIVDAHTLQHPEIHGRWSNHFHLSRLHLIFKFDIKWSYAQSPKLSDHLNAYKVDKPDEYLVPPAPRARGNITTTDIKARSKSPEEGKKWIKKWALEVYDSWRNHHDIAESIAQGYLSQLQRG